MFLGSAYLFAIIKYLSFVFFSVYSFYNATFFHSGYVIKLPQSSSAIYGALPFASNPYLTVTHREGAVGLVGTN